MADLQSSDLTAETVTPDTGTSTNTASIRKETIERSSISPAPLASSICYFSRLSAELRALVYEQLWLDTPKVKTYYYRSPIETRFRNITEPAFDPWHFHRTRRGLPSWLLTCKSFLREGLHTLRSDCTVSVSPCHRSRNLSASTRQGDIHSILLGPVLDGRIKVSCNNLDRPGPYNRNNFEIEQNEMEDIYKLLYAAIRNEKFSVLRISVSLDRKWYDIEKKAGLRLNELLELKLQLDAFELEIIRETKTLCAQHPEPLQYWEALRDGFVHEVQRVGRVLVGGNGVVDVRTSLDGQKDGSVLIRFSKVS